MIVAFRPSRPRFLLGALVLLPAVLAVACVTVNIYFPAPEVREAAEKIVDETWGTVAPPPDERRSSLPARLLRAAAGLVSAGEAHAAGIDVNVSTAAIRAIKDAMKQRAAELRPYLASGAVGVAKTGLLAERDPAGLDLAARARVRRLLEAENRDRESLYREIATANDYGADKVGEIRAIFADTWRAKAEPGWWVQGSDGAWTRK